jgi:type VI secretion system secreted protein Hcp
MNVEEATNALSEATGMIGGAHLIHDSSNDVYLKIEGVEGEAQDDKHKKEIEIRAVDFTEWQQGSSGSGGGSGASRPTFEFIKVTAPVSKAGPKLFLACAKGDRFSKAIFSFRKSGGGQQDYMAIKLSDVAVTRYAQRLDEFKDGSVEIVDCFNLDYAKIEVEYKPQNPDGSLGSPLVFDFDLRGK